MQIRDTEDGFGLVTRLLHWLMALAIFFLFGLGIWMVRLDYYSPYYTKGPDLHRSLGIVTAALLVARFVWVLSNTKPENPELTRSERITATIVQWSFYPLLFAIVASGYLISTTDGRGIDVFGLFTLPSAVTDRSVTDMAGFTHRWLAYGTVALALLHATAALKHHFWDRNAVLKRMVWSSSKSEVPRNRKFHHNGEKT